MKGKGFTLIELLAVIVILAVIAIISGPIIIGIVENAKKSALESSVVGYIKSIETQITSNEMASDKIKFKDGIYNVPLSKKLGVTVSGKIPTSGWIEIKDGRTNRYSLVIENYVVSFDGNLSKTESGNIFNNKPEGSTTVVFPGGTKENATEGETHKGIVYLDPTNLEASCDSTNYISTTDTKTGCMKWYIFDDSNNEYKMLLDHNTTALNTWANNNYSGITYDSSNLKAHVDALVTTYNWQVTPRLITALEIVAITGKDVFDVDSSDSEFYFDTLTTTKADFTDAERSNYDWLYNNTYKCKSDNVDYGCTSEDNNFYTSNVSGNWDIDGYWASTNSYPYHVWVVDKTGKLKRKPVAGLSGIRPVITILKSQVL